jgi:hypothetical protein
MGPRWRLAVLAGLFTLVTACGSGENDGGSGVASISDKDTPTSTAPGEGDGSEVDQMRAYAKCMREHGIDMADPEVGPGGASGGIGISIDGEAEKEKVDKANEECKELLPNGGEPPKMTAEDLDNARKMAKCLREHGIDVKDPTMEDPGINVSAGEGGNDPEKVDKAMEECAPEGAVIGHKAEPAK